jgi:2-dehydropantoate 2-reductase
MNLRIAVVGSGAIGLYYGGKLAAGGRDVHFLLRSSLPAIRDRGLQIRGENEDLRLKINCYPSTQEIGVCDLVLIAVKTISNNELRDLIPPLLHQDTLLLTLQNGLGNEEFLAKNFGERRVLGGLCFICLNRILPDVVERYDYGHIHIGEYCREPEQRTHNIAETFNQCGLKCRLVENLGRERWRKLVWNIPFNGLSIFGGGIDTSAILKDENLHRSALALMEEVMQAASKCGFPLESSTPEELIRRTEMMGAYKPSTLVDFEKGKPLEIEAIWGEPLRRGLVAGADLPRLQLLYSLLQFVDRACQEKATDRQ